MPEPTEPASKPPRTWRPMAAWTAGILLVLGLCWLSAQALRVRRTSQVVAEVYSATFTGTRRFQELAVDAAIKTSVQKMGGPESAVREISLYLRLPAKFAGRKETAVLLLRGCGPAAEGQLKQILASPEAGLRQEAVHSLSMLDIDSDRKLSALTGLLEDRDSEVRAAAAEALKKIRGEEPKK